MNEPLLTNLPSNRKLGELSTHETKLPDGKNLWLVIILTVTILFAGTLYISPIMILLVSDREIGLFQNPTTTVLIVGIIFTIVFIPWGLATGWVWKKLGNFTFKQFYFNPIRGIVQHKSRPTTLFGKLKYYLYTGNSDKIFLHLRTKDTNISNFNNIVRNSFGLIFIYLSILVLVLKLFQPVFQPITEYYLYAILFFVCFSIALIIMACYFPYRTMIDHTRLMVINDEGGISHAGSKLTNFIDGFISILGILSGFTLVRSQLEKENIIQIYQTPGITFIITVLIYIAIILISIVLVSPIMIPALLVYYNDHSEKVNEARKNFLDLEGVELRYSGARLLSKIQQDEINKYSLDEIHIDKWFKDNPKIHDKPLNKYFIQCSHNSYSPTILNLDPDPLYTYELLKMGYRCIEIDVYQKKLGVLSRILSKPSAPILVGHAGIALHEVELRDFLIIIRKWHEFILDMELSHLPLIVNFDVYDRQPNSDDNIGSEVAETILNEFSPILQDVFKPGQVDVSNGRYDWPAVDKLANKLILTVHKKYYEDLNEDQVQYFFEDTKQHFANYGYEDIHKTEISNQIPDDLHKNKLVRVYPKGEINFRECVEKKIQLIAVDQFNIDFKGFFDKSPYIEIR